MDENEINPYKEAYNRGLITNKDYINVIHGKIYDDEGVELEKVEVYHNHDENRFVGYYIPEGYKSIRVYFNTKMGLHSLLKYFDKVCFNISFLNKDKDFDVIYSYAKAISSYMFRHYNVRKEDALIEYLITKGLETTDEEYLFNDKMRKFYFTDNKLSGDERKEIALINTNRNRQKTIRYKVEEAIEYFIQGTNYISQKDLAKFLDTTIRNVNRNLTKEDKDRIKKRNIELTGFPTQNEYTKAKNIDKVIDAYLELKDNEIKVNATNISKLTDIHRVTVSKILKEEDIFTQL